MKSFTFVLALFLGVVSFIPVAAASGGLFGESRNESARISDRHKLKAAQQALSKQDFALVIRLCNEVLTAGRLHHELLSLAHDFRGRAYFGTNRPDKALADFDQAIALAPNHPYQYLYKGELLRQLKQYKKALDAYDRYFELVKSPEPGAWLERASALMALDRCRDAIPDITHYREARPKDAAGYLFLGECHWALDDYKAAVAAFDRYFELAESPIPVERYKRAYAFYQLDRYPEAVKDLKRYVKLASSDPNGYELLGICYTDMGDGGSAVKVFKQYFALTDSPSAEALYKYGKALLYLGHREQALKIFTQRRRSYPDKCCSNWWIGIIDYFTGDYDAAEAAFRREAKVGKTSRLYIAIFLSLIAEGHGTDPVAVLDRNLVGSDKIPQLGGLIAALHGGSEQAAIDAVRHLSKVEKGPRYQCETYTYLAERALIQGRRKQAETWFADAVALGTMDDEAIFARWRLEELHGGK